MGGAQGLGSKAISRVNPDQQEGQEEKEWGVQQGGVRGVQGEAYVPFRVVQRVVKKKKPWTGGEEGGEGGKGGKGIVIRRIRKSKGDKIRGAKRSLGSKECAKRAERGGFHMVTERKAVIGEEGDPGNRLVEKKCSAWGQESPCGRKITLTTCGGGSQQERKLGGGDLGTSKAR